MEELFLYVDNPSDKNHEGLSRAIYQIEINRLGLEDSTLLFPGDNVDLHIKIGEGISLARFRSKVFIEGAKDMEGRSLPILAKMSYYEQPWDTGGSYLNPEEISGDEVA